MTHNFKTLSQQIKQWGIALGFQQVGISDIDLQPYEKRLAEWLARGLHGEMAYMEKHGKKRSEPASLIPDTLRVISVRMDYLSVPTKLIQILQNPNKAYISRYALGRDYHRVIKKRLEILSQQIEAAIPETQYRVFCDSAPVLEKPLAEKAGLGWIGKHTNLINSKAGSWFFLGEIYTNLPLEIDKPMTKSHCGSCHACLDICPTQAIIAPYQLDARRCISYLTIELKGSIPVDLRPLLGNRIYGCDDCQLICPWNKFSKMTAEDDFKPRHQLADSDLVALFNWDEATFLKKTEGSAIRRIGYVQWLRNIAVALGNAPQQEEVKKALWGRMNHESDIVREHVEWAYRRQM